MEKIENATISLIETFLGRSPEIVGKFSIIGDGWGTCMCYNLYDMCLVLETNGDINIKDVPCRAFIVDDITRDIGHFIKDKWISEVIKSET